MVKGDDGWIHLRGEVGRWCVVQMLMKKHFSWTLLLLSSMIWPAPSVGSIDCSRLSIILLAYFKDVNKLMYLADHMACVIADWIHFKGPCTKKIFSLQMALGLGKLWSKMIERVFLKVDPESKNEFNVADIISMSFAYHGGSTVQFLWTPIATSKNQHSGSWNVHCTDFVHCTWKCSLILKRECKRQKLSQVRTFCALVWKENVNGKSQKNMRRPFGWKW